MGSFSRWIKRLFKKEIFLSHNDSFPMHWARLNRADKIFANVLTRDDIAYRNKRNETFLTLCIKSNLNFLVINAINTYPEFINQTTKQYEETLLMTSIRYNNIEIFNFLINRGADVNFISPTGDTALNMSIPKTEFYNILFNHKKLDLCQAYPISRHPLLNSSNSDDKFISLIKRGITSRCSTRDIIKIIKFHLSKFNYEVINNIFIQGFQKDENIDFNHVLLLDKEGICDNKLLIHEEEIKKFKYINSKLENFHKKIGLKNRFIIKSFYQNILKQKDLAHYSQIVHVNCNLINSIEFIKGLFPEIDENLLRPLMTSRNNFDFNENDLKGLKKLLNGYNERRIVNIVENGARNREIIEVIHMHTQLVRYSKANSINIKSLFPHSPNSIKDFHECFQNLIRKIGKDNIPIHANIPKYIKDIEGKTVDEYTVSIPKSNAELISVGQELSICIGNNYYAEEMAQGNLVIIFLKKKNVVRYCVEYNPKARTIIQAKTFYNNEMKKDLKLKLEKIIKQP